MSIDDNIRERLDGYEPPEHSVLRQPDSRLSSVFPPPSKWSSFFFPTPPDEYRRLHILIQRLCECPYLVPIYLNSLSLHPVSSCLFRIVCITIRFSSPFGTGGIIDPSPPWFSVCLCSTDSISRHRFTSCFLLFS